MKVSLSWLADYVDIQLPVRQLAEALTMRGLEVESITERYDYLASVVVGRVTDITPHAAGSHLNICRVDSGESVCSVVCGAPNVAVGVLAPLALPQTVLPGGLTVRAGNVHGVLSAGMLCSPAELMLGPQTDGLMLLDSSLVPGTPLAAALHLSDMVFEIGLTPNRSDCLCLLGIAREIAALQGSCLKYPEITVRAPDGPIHALTSVTLDAPEHCHRYAAQLLTNINVGPAPFWLQNRLLSVGLRPVNNIVDITNYVMLECGQPLHAFDFDRLDGRRIVVRRASSEETFITLDNKARHLDQDTLVICDAHKPVALAGVMGGLDSEITPQTTRVLLESACFNPAGIRRTAKRFGMNTDASHRFERGVNPLGTVTAMHRTADLMECYAGACPTAGYIDVQARPHAPVSLEVTGAYVNRLLGTSIHTANMADLLESIEFKTSRGDEDRLKVDVPAYRVDVLRPVDLVEEVARLAGYDAVPVTFPTTISEYGAGGSMVGVRKRLRELMTGLGFTETITYSFIAASCAARLNLPPGDSRCRSLEIMNPISEDQAVMRTSLVPGLLQTLQRNVAFQNRNVRIFEIGKTFALRDDNQLPLETDMLAGLWSGLRHEPSWHFTETACDFYDLKGALEALLAALGLDAVEFIAHPASPGVYRTSASALVQSHGRSIGSVGEVEAAVLAAFDIKQPVFVFELNGKLLALDMAKTRPSAKPLPRFPSVARDLTLILPETLEARRLLQHITAMQEPLVEDTLLFAVFQGGALPVARKSISIRIYYRSPDKNLTDEEINDLHKHICDQLVETFGAALP